MPGRRSNAALLLVGHGTSRSKTPWRELRAHAMQIAAMGMFAEVRAAQLQGGDSVAAALVGLSDRPVVAVPYFMSDGYFAREALPRALAAAGRAVDGKATRLAPPVGLDPALASLIASRALTGCDRLGASADRCRVLLIAHGSTRDPASADATIAQAERVKRARRFADVETAFLDQRPTIGEVLEMGEGPLVAVGLFAAGGPHADDDVPVALGGYGGGPSHYTGAIGADPAMAEIVLSCARSALDAGHRG